MIHLTEEQLDAIRQHGATEFPRECCGVMIGDVEQGAKVVSEVRPLPNTFEPSAEFEQSVEGGRQDAQTAPVGQERRYMVSPDTMFRLMQEERQTKRKVLGFYHSHPNHPARPSEYDRVWAMPWYSYVIVSVQQGNPAELTCWLLNDDATAFVPETIRTE